MKIQRNVCMFKNVEVKFGAVYLCLTEDKKRL